MFLHMLALAAPSKTLVEVGTLGGYSAAWLACAISGGSLHTIERDAKRAAFAQQNLHAAGLASRVHVINEPALDAICKLRATMQDGSVGLVFLDAQKSEYISYFQQLERLVAPVSFLLPPPSSPLPLGRHARCSAWAVCSFMLHWQGGWVVADNCLGTRRVWIDMTGRLCSRLLHSASHRALAQQQIVTVAAAQATATGRTCTRSTSSWRGSGSSGMWCECC
jgi:hypothetical protein